jgi:PAS domain S-box-containing protein
MHMTIQQASSSQSGQTNGAWSGWRMFRIAERHRESQIITSFILRPIDGGRVQRHQPGQYLTVLVEVPGRGEQKRNYSISSGPDDSFYRMSIKREPQGTVSKWFHDQAEVGTEIKVGPPAGDFFLPLADQTRPVVLLSGGVGLTPMISMLEAVVQSGSNLPVFYVHSALNSGTHAMGAHVRELADGRPNIHVASFYSNPSPADVPCQHFDHAGRITVDWLRANTPADADYFICGPVPFLRAFVTGLPPSGVALDRIHYEFFGEVEKLLEAWPEALDIVPANAAPTSVQEAKRLDAPSPLRAEIGDAFLNTEADAVIVSDREGYITLWNPGAERIFGFTEAEALGQSLDIIIPETLRGRHWEGYRETATSGHSRYGAGDLLAVPALRKDGQRISVEFTITMLKNAEGVTGMIAVLRDVTPRFEETRALRKKLAALEAKVAVNP